MSASPSSPARKRAASGFVKDGRWGVVDGIRLSSSRDRVCAMILSRDFARAYVTRHISRGLMSTDLSALSATEAALRIARRELSSEALVNACLARIAAREPEVQAWAFLDPELARTQARKVDRESPRSLLHGVP